MRWEHTILPRHMVNTHWLKSQAATKSTSTLFTPQLTQSNTLFQVTMNNSYYLLKFNAHVKSHASPISSSSMPLLVPTRVSKRETILITYTSLIKSLFISQTTSSTAARGSCLNHHPSYQTFHELHTINLYRACITKIFYIKSNLKNNRFTSFRNIQVPMVNLWFE